MNKTVLKWAKENIGEWFESPRSEFFGSRAQDFRIVEVDEEEQLIKIQFEKSNYSALPLYFWMFDRTLEYLKNNQAQFIRLGAKLQPPYHDNSVEKAIWREPFPSVKSQYKSSPHVTDILALAGLVEYGYTRNPSTGRKVQAVKYIDKHTTLKKPETRGKRNTIDEKKMSGKESFLDQYKDTILAWIEENREAVIDGRRNYSWDGKSLIDCLNQRNEISWKIVKSRIENNGAVDLETLDEVMSWGGFGKFPSRDREKVSEITRDAFNALDNGDVKEAVLRLLSLHGVGISRASKIIGLSNQDKYCIYDSRVGNALKSLTHDSSRIILCPPGRSISGDACTYKGWTENYEKLLWTVEAMRDYLNKEGYPFRIADIEMALFMIGKP